MNTLAPVLLAMTLAVAEPITVSPPAGEAEPLRSPPEMIIVPTRPPVSRECWETKIKLLYHMNQLHIAAQSGEGSLADNEGMLEAILDSLRLGCW